MKSSPLCFGVFHRTVYERFARGSCKSIPETGLCFPPQQHAVISPPNAVGAHKPRWVPVPSLYKDGGDDSRGLGPGLVS